MTQLVEIKENYVKKHKQEMFYFSIRNSGLTIRVKEFFDYMLQYNINTITNNTPLKDFANLNNYNYWSLYMLFRRVLGNSGDYKSKLNELFAKYKNN